jgi:hypothetical protein
MEGSAVPGDRGAEIDSVSLWSLWTIEASGAGRATLAVAWTGSRTVGAEIVSSSQVTISGTLAAG